jgi:L-threonylcarbamoyladenylate synthase
MTNPLPVDRLVQHLLRDEPVLFPTDTVPALAIRPSAAERIWTLKQRPAHKPLILMGADQAQLEMALAGPWLPEWREEAQRVWPGAVTLVLPASGPLVEALNPGGESLGLRVPDCTLSQALLRQSGPLASTSVNLSGQPPALTAEEASWLFPDLALLGPLPWPSGSGIPSEVRAWSSGGWSLLRSQPSRMS